MLIFHPTSLFWWQEAVLSILACSQINWLADHLVSLWPPQFNLAHTLQSHVEKPVSLAAVWSWLYMHSAVPNQIVLSFGSKIYLNILTERRSQWHWQPIFNQWATLQQQLPFFFWDSPSRADKRLIYSPVPL